VHLKLINSLLDEIAYLVTDHTEVGAILWSHGREVVQCCIIYACLHNTLCVMVELQATVSATFNCSSPHVGYTAPAVFFGAPYSVRSILYISRRISSAGKVL